jgi:hypothetical protein
VSTYPVFVFERRREVEIENPDFELAGTLRFNTFGRRRPTRRQLLELEEIIRGLTNDARAGRLPLDCVVVGWGGVGLKPLDAADVTDETVMRPWIRRAFTTAVRVTRSDECATSAGNERIWKTPERTPL